MNCKILLIDSPAEILIMQESITSFPIPVQLTCVTTITEALAALDIELPELILPGSGQSGYWDFLF